MITIHLYKAQGLRGKPPVESATLYIEHEITTAASLDDARAIYQKEAETLAKILFYALPGGVIDALLIEFLSRKRSLLFVPYSASQESNS